MAEHTRVQNRALHALERHFGDQLALASDEAARHEVTAQHVLREFDAYYRASRIIPRQAQEAFENRDAGRSLALSLHRLSLYNRSIERLVQVLSQAYPGLTQDEALWNRVETVYLAQIAERYEADLAFAFILSARRKIFRGAWRPVEYLFDKSVQPVADYRNEMSRAFPCAGSLAPDVLREILMIPQFQTPYRDIEGDIALVVDRVSGWLEAQGFAQSLEAVQMVDAGFYRNRGAYLVGQLCVGPGPRQPFVLALLNSEAGIFIDAVLMSESDCHNIFSSTLANFHVTTPFYHELCAFLYSIMPSRPLGLHYSTIGFNHVGKLAVMEELRSELAETAEVLDTAVGFPGTVAIGFAAASSAYTFKVIRDKPTANYKWGEFSGVASVLQKYSRVHEINRTGSMLDNVIYYNLTLERDWFAPGLLEELLSEASDCVSLHGDLVFFKHLIAQFKMIPLPVFLETAGEGDAETAVRNLGHCIKNNAAANVFNKDLDGRNYGVSPFLKVYLFDYDALEPFTEVKIRTNLGREDGEEDIPDWFFEEGVIFLPEEIELGLRIPNRTLRRLFRETHGDLMTTAYWETVQKDLREGRVPSIRTYPESRALRPDTRP